MSNFCACMHARVITSVKDDNTEMTWIELSFFISCNVPVVLNAERADNTSIHNACANRPCKEDEVCVPGVGTNTVFKCLHFPATCAQPDLPRASASATGFTQGHVANVTCLPGFTMTPSTASTRITCLVTSQWTRFEATCEQVIFAFWWVALCCREEKWV